MTTICTLKQLFPAMKNAADDEVPVLRSGIKMVSRSAMTLPLMELEYAVNDSALEMARKYADIS